MLLPGDYDANHVVDQGDLDLVLANWGDDAPTPPDGWIRNLPRGRVDQAELDPVLLNWGDVQPVPKSISAVPEPASLALLVVGILCAVLVACGAKRQHTTASA